MNPSTVFEARSRADQAFAQKQFSDALAGYLCALAAQPDHLDARLRTAD